MNKNLKRYAAVLSVMVLFIIIGNIYFLFLRYKLEPIKEMWVMALGYINICSIFLYIAALFLFIKGRKEEFAFEKIAIGLLIIEGLIMVCVLTFILIASGFDGSNFLGHV